MPRLSPARQRQLHTFALWVVPLLLALIAVADVSVDRPRGPYDWEQRVIILLPGVCAQPAELPPTPNLPSVPMVTPPSHWPVWPDWLICGGAQAMQNARARALGTFVGGWGSPAQLANLLNQALQSGADDDSQSSLSISFSIRAIEAFSYAGDAPTYTSAQTRQPLAVSAAALDQQFRHWRGEYPNATFDLIGHSLGGAVAVYWAARVATPDEQRAIHSIITLDSPLGGYPRSYADNFFLPFFGPVAQGLLAGSPGVAAIAGAPDYWRAGPGTLASPIVTITNVRDLVAPFFLATIPGAVLVADDYGSDNSSLNHGSVLASPAALAQIAQVLAQEGMPLLAPTHNPITSTLAGGLHQLKPPDLTRQSDLFAARLDS
jgi:pimeloyl-ACP methyl ester carboxylesterase